MRTADFWLDRYSRHRRRRLNRVLHAAAVPLAVLGLTGLLWSLLVAGSLLTIFRHERLLGYSIDTSTDGA